MDRRYLNEEERADHDALMEEAGYGAPVAALITGAPYESWQPTPYSSDQIKGNLVRMIDDARQGGQRQWAHHLYDDAVADGLLSHWKAWNNNDRKLKVFHNGLVLPARAVRGIRRRDESGAVVHQQEFWAEMSWDEVIQEITKADARIAAEQVTKSIAVKLLKLKVQVPDSATPGEACRQLGMDIQSYLLDSDLAA